MNEEYVAICHGCETQLFSTNRVEAARRDYPWLDFQPREHCVDEDGFLHLSWCQCENPQQETLF